MSSIPVEPFLQRHIRALCLGEAYALEQRPRGDELQTCRPLWGKYPVVRVVCLKRHICGIRDEGAVLAVIKLFRCWATKKLFPGCVTEVFAQEYFCDNFRLLTEANLLFFHQGLAFSCYYHNVWCRFWCRALIFFESASITWSSWPATPFCSTDCRWWRGRLSLVKGLSL